MEAQHIAPAPRIPTLVDAWQSQWRVILTRTLRDELEQLGLIVSDGMIRRTVEHWLTMQPTERKSHAHQDE